MIAEEELAKLILLPIAKELDDFEDLLNNRRSSYFNHRIKQKLFTSFGLQNRKHNEIETLKQECLYVGADKQLKPTRRMVTPKNAYLEIKHTVKLLLDSAKNIMSTDELSNDLKKIIMFTLNLLKGCILEKMPELAKDMLDEIEKIESEHAMKPEMKGHWLNEQLVTNPYSLIGIFKAIYKKDYKKHLGIINKMSSDEVIEYIYKTMEE